MGLYKFSIAAAAAPSDIETKITSVRGQGANIYGEIKYIGLQPSGEVNDEEILENMQYLTKKFKLDQEG